MPFATLQDVATRLGRSLTTPESNLAEYIIETTTGLIVEAVGRDLAWADALDPVPATLKAICVEKAIAVGTNPNQLATHTEELGVARETRTFRPGGGTAGSTQPDIYLTADEERRARRAIGGPASRSVVLPSVVDNFAWPMFPFGQINLPEPETMAESEE